MGATSLAKLTVTTLLLCAAFAAGLTAAWLSMTPAAPASLGSPDVATTAPVIEQQFADQRTVALDLAFEPGARLESGVAGRVSATRCSPGSMLRSGTTLLEIDGQPLIVLSTSVPLWRDIAIGDTGKDVAALQTELHRLGYPVTPDGTAGPVTMQALAKLVAAAGDSHLTGDAVSFSRIVWFPESAATVASCGAALGATVGAGDTLATLAGSLTRVSVEKLPTDLVPGDRVLTVDAISVPFHGDGVVSEPSALRQLAAAPSFSHAAKGDITGGDAADGPVEPVSAQLSLTTKARVGVVPPAAVYSISQNRGCIASAGVGYPVSIVGSQLGQTYVLIDSEKQLRRVDISTKDRPPCG